jgi:hypothetical protein
MSTEDRDNILEHYGVPGMKWGVRRSRAERKAAREERKAAKKQSDDDTGSGSKSSGGRGDKITKGEKTRYEEKSKNLTDSELQARIKRMETEKRYNDLNKRDISTGEKLVAEVITNVGKQVVTQVLTKQGTKKGNDLFKKLESRGQPPRPDPKTRVKDVPKRPTSTKVKKKD